MTQNDDALMALFTVITAALALMMLVLMVGTWYDNLFPRAKKLSTVPCSASIRNMALNYNVTLLDECVIEK